MRDLELWRHLAAGAASVNEVRPLVAFALPQRAPYLAWMPALASHADPAMRCAALAVLAGSRGIAGVRAIVAGLDDEVDTVRAAALDALRLTSSSVPNRYVHALFHPRADVRRAALADVPRGFSDAPAYLRADPACAELARALPWPAHPLPLAWELRNTGMLTARELIDVINHAGGAELGAFLLAERRRDPAALATYLDACSTAKVLATAPGDDVLDVMIDALAELDDATTDDAMRARDRCIEMLVQLVGPKRSAVHVRIVAALLTRLARNGEAAWLVGLIGALYPRALEMAAFPRAHAAAVVAAMVRFRWPVRLQPAQTDRLLALPWIRADLALATAVCGMYPSGRLKKLAAAIGEPALLAHLLRSNAGWEVMCSFPDEKLYTRWLLAIESTSIVRYIELAGIAHATFKDKRLQAFVQQLQRRYRHLALGAYLANPAVAPDDPHLLALATLVAERIDRTGFAEVFATLLAANASERGPLLARVFARVLSDKLLASVATLLSDDALARLVPLLDGLDALPRDRELALAKVLRERTHPALVAWAIAVDTPSVAPVALPQPSLARFTLTEAEQLHVSTCSPADLDTALTRAMVSPSTGLAAALAGRTAHPCVSACVALLVCADPLADVARQLDRFAVFDDTFNASVDNTATKRWARLTDLPPLAHARLWRWEAHAFAFGAWVDASGGLLAVARALDALAGSFALDTLWKGLAEIMLIARYRDRPRFDHMASTELAVFAAERVDRSYGRHAATIVVQLVEARAVPVAAVRNLILDRAADADAASRAELLRVTRLDGLPDPPSVQPTGPIADLIAAIQRTRDLEILVRYCADVRAAVVQEAVLAMLDAGDAGQRRLARLLAHPDQIGAPGPVLASVGLWDEPEALAIVRELAARADLPAQWRFYLCLAIENLDGALAAAREPGTTWFRRDDWETLVRGRDELAIALALADAEQHHAYTPAMRVVFDQHPAPAIADALRRFLEAGSERPLFTRRAAARRLVMDYGDLTGLPVLVEELVDTGEVGWLAKVPVGKGAQVLDAILGAALVGGHTACTEKRMWAVYDRLRDCGALDDTAAVGACARILDEGMTTSARQIAAQLAVGEKLAHARLTRIAEVFAWGVRRGLELTGRRMRIHLTSKERDLGHTYLTEGRIFVSPLPMLRDEAYGQDVVEGLILHELGHHAYHRSEEAQALWKQAHAEGIGHLLNLVADEHLERNLRAVDRSYGDRLKRLDAYAFQHASQELGVAYLLRVLRGSAATALIHTPLGVAFDEGSVRIRRGAMLAQLERAGHPLARFARALRMGLGNRHDDPRIAAALALCSKDLRKLDMRGLYALTQQLAALFGGSIAIAQVFGGSEGLEVGDQSRDHDVHGAGIDDEILQREVERILAPQRDKRSKGDGKPDRLQINVNPDEEFEHITTVQRVRGDAEEHRRLAHEVHRHSVRLREHLDELGLRWEPARARIKGHMLDRGRLRALVTRGDPKILIARRPVRRTDLFLGTVIDCSGSMSAGRNIDRAKRFGVLISEAVRALPGVEARFFGFTDSVIYDAGDASACDVTALRADGGNNDAAALLHVAHVAAGSRKRARVIVMISDGLPTECSVAALRGLVTTLTKRKGIVCAQVAVRRLEEECFPNYVVLDDEQLDVAVARFGRMIGDLARKVLG
ncbi:MAG: hypothetical protein SFX73_29450 [Kofleriaceae bacterium]|nr:hypothetical protein [Kofleriaceae bacterium]